VVLTPNEVQVIASVVVVVVLLHLFLGGCAYSILLERKLSAWMQDRVGPNRVGPHGAFQPLADGLKFLLKEDYNPRGVDKWLFLLAPGFIMIPAMIGFVIVPFAQQIDITGLVNLFGVAQPGTEYLVRLVGADINVGLIYFVAVGSIGVYGVVLGGWASNNKFSFLGGLRASAQMISYEIPMGLALLTIVLVSGTINPFEIIAHQQETAWNLLQMPVAAVLFYVCMLAESNRAPFDLAEAESELIGGYHTEYSSMKFALFFLAEYYHMIAGAAFFTMLFLGGWSVNPIAGIIPWDFTNTSHFWLLGLIQAGIVLAKMAFLIAFAMAVRWTLPRFRFDQLMRLAWEGMIPTALVMVLLCSVWVFFGWQNWMFLASLATIVIIFTVHPFMPRQPQPNRRIKIIGSRFSPPEATSSMNGEGSGIATTPLAD
jgi:NADH-quinone oxidoreductase subunit H